MLLATTGCACMNSLQAKQHTLSKVTSFHLLQHSFMSKKNTHPVTWVLLVVSVSVAGSLWTRDPDIAEIMDRGFQNGLAAKVAAGDASSAEQEELDSLLNALQRATPGRGDLTAWREKTSHLSTALQQTLDGVEAAPDDLRAAINCAHCHKEHR